MLERYGVTHNWKSKDPVLNGRATMFKNSGSKENHYKMIISKGRQTKLNLYGDENYSNHEKAIETCQKKYGVPYYVLVPGVQEKSYSTESQNKKYLTMKKNHTFGKSKPEVDFYKFLVGCFGEENIIKEYMDPRYSDEDGRLFKCDFYIKSKDIFIELNLHPTHGKHPFDPNNKSDLLLLEKLNNLPTEWNKTFIDVWTNRDVKKLNCAIKNNLKYYSFYPGDNYYDIIQRI